MTGCTSAIGSTGSRLFVRLFQDAFGLFMFCGPALAGTLYHLLPFFVTRVVSNRIPTPGRMTVSMYRLAVGVPVYVLWSVVSAWWMSRSLPGWVVWICCCVMPFAGLVALEYWRRARGVGRSLCFQARLWFHRSRLRELRRTHAEISGQLGDLAARYDAELESISASV